MKNLKVIEVHLLTRSHTVTGGRVGMKSQARLAHTPVLSLHSHL